MIDIVVPYEIPSQNRTDRMHWTKRSAQRDDLVWMLKVALGAQAHRLVPQRRHRRMVLTSWRTKLITDRANLIGGAKGLVDAIVAAGLLRDDADEWVHIEYAQALKRESPTRAPATRIVITEQGEGFTL